MTTAGMSIPGEPISPVPVIPDAERLSAVRLMGVDLAAVTEAQAVEHILHALQAGRGGQVVTVNLDILRRCGADAAFRDHVQRAELVVADGMPLVWASRLQGTPLPERVAGSSMVSTLAGAAAGAGRSLFFLGGDPGAAEGAAASLLSRFPKLDVVGTYCPSFGFENNPEEMGVIEQRLRSARPDIVYVALGSPKQERLIERLRPIVPGAWWLGVGISLGFLSGQVRRAPGWVQKLGLEWAHRLLQEPKRLARRYLVDGLPFAVRLLGSAMLQRLGGRRRDRKPG